MSDSTFSTPLDRTRWSGVIRHARLWRACLGMALVRESHFRANMLAIVVVGLVQVMIAIIPVLLLFSYTESVSGWSQAGVIVLLGVHQVLMSLLAMFVAPNLTRMTEYVTHGDLDLLLIRPVNTQWFVTTRWIQPAQAFNVATGILLVAIGLWRSAESPGMIDAGQGLVVFLAGFVLVTCAWAAMSFLVFWLSSVVQLTWFVHDVMGAARYPVTFFPAVLRAILTFVVPLAFATTFPAQALTGGISWWVVSGAVVFAVAAVVLVRLLWVYAVRFYASASS